MPRGLAAPSAGDVAFLFLLSAIWGSSFLFIKVAVVHIPPVSLTTLRLLVAGIILCVYGFFRGQRLPGTARAWRPYLVIALFGNAFPFTLVGVGELEIDSGQAAILLGAMPIFTLILAHYFAHDEPLTPRRALGIMVGLSGILVLVLPAMESEEQFTGSTLFKLAVVMAALSYAIATVYGRRLSHVSPLLITTASTVTAAAIMVPASLILDKQWLGALVAGTTATPGVAALGAAVMLGVLCTAAAGIIFFRLLGRTGATFTSQINFLIPAFGVLWGFLLLGESLSWNLAVAMTLILGGIALTRGGGRGGGGDESGENGAVDKNPKQPD